MNNNPSDHFIGVAAVALVSLALWHRFGARIWDFLVYNLVPLSLMGFGVLVLIILLITERTRPKRERKRSEKRATAFEKSAVFLGYCDQTPVFLRQGIRTEHLLVTGATGVGKTSGVVLPIAVSDIRNGHGLIIIDGKADLSFRDQLYAQVVKAGRKDDFRLFSLFDIAHSSTLNPLSGASPEMVAERVFSSFPVENPYYREAQYSAFLTLLRLLAAHDTVPTFEKIAELLSIPTTLQALIAQTKEASLVQACTSLAYDLEHTDNISGLVAYVRHFATGPTGQLFNVTRPSIDMETALLNRQICLFQLPTMMFPFLGRVTGHLVLQLIQSAVSKRHVGGNAPFCSLILDDFQDFIYEGFVSILNKSRSANVGVTFSHQSLGDLAQVSPSFENRVLSNTNSKIVMRTNDPITCDYFAKMFGTLDAQKKTWREQNSILGSTSTGESSVRDVKEYRIHPDVIKTLPRGMAVILVPHPSGLSTKTIALCPLPNLAPVPLPTIQHAIEAPVTPELKSELISI